MRDICNEDFDSFFLRVNRLLEMEEEVFQGEDTDFELGFSIQIPRDFSRMVKEEAENIFWSKNRPPVLFARAGRNEGITFQILSGAEDREPEDWGRRAKELLNQGDRRTVFYGDGNEGKTYWMEYKSFAARERIYNILFLFQVGKDMIMGTFYCLFQDYQIWRSRILQMLHTIRTEENTDEGI